MTTAALDIQQGSTREGGAAMPPTISLKYRLDETFVAGNHLGFRHVERWHVSICAAGGAGPDEGDTIGYAQVLILNLTPAVGIDGLVDRATGEWIDLIAAPASDPSQRRAVEQASGGIGDHLLVLDRLWIEPAWRGQGLGPIAAAAAVLRLGRGCRYAACYPAPFEPMNNPEDRTRSIAALGAIWAIVGFRLWDDGVWMLDLAATDLHAVLQDLLASRTDLPGPAPKATASSMKVRGG